MFACFGYLDAIQRTLRNQKQKNKNKKDISIKWISYVPETLADSVDSCPIIKMAATAQMHCGNVDDVTRLANQKADLIVETLRGIMHSDYNYAFSHM